jgi:peptidoglycan/LPS O-acetylase OafA/YrhL
LTQRYVIERMAPHFPQRYAHFAYGVLQAALTTAVATAIAIFPLAHSSMEFVERWMLAWAIAWVTMLPVVLLASPLIQRAVQSFCDPKQSPDH